MAGAPDRAAYFIDGNDWYHGCVGLGLRNLGRLNYAKVCQKLAGTRQWTQTRFYIGRVPHTGNTQLASGQQRFLESLRRLDSRIEVHLGRLEPRQVTNEAAVELKHYLATLPVRIDTGVYRDLVRMADRHASSTIMVEKAVDVQIAVDMVVMAERNEYDTAFLLSADGDLTPAVEAVRSKGRRVFVASPSSGARLAAACDTFIRLNRAWFEGLFS